MSSLGLPIHSKYIWYTRNPYNSGILSFTPIYICYVDLLIVSCVIRQLI